MSNPIVAPSPCSWTYHLHLISELFCEYLIVTILLCIKLWHDRYFKFQMILCTYIAEAATMKAQKGLNSSDCWWLLVNLGFSQVLYGKADFIFLALFYHLSIRILEEWFWPCLFKFKNAIEVQLYFQVIMGLLPNMVIPCYSHLQSEIYTL